MKQLYSMLYGVFGDGVYQIHCKSNFGPILAPGSQGAQTAASDFRSHSAI